MKSRYWPAPSSCRSWRISMRFWCWSACFWCLLWLFMLPTVQGAQCSAIADRRLQLPAKFTFTAEAIPLSAPVSRAKGGNSSGDYP